MDPPLWRVAGERGGSRGRMWARFVVTGAAGEAAIGLAIRVAFFRNGGSIEVEDVNLMKG